MAEFIDKESEVYKKRQEHQELRRRYRERALQIYADSNVSITPTSTPVVQENGAFIDAVVFIPKDELKIIPIKKHALSCPAYGNYQPPYEECNCGADK